MTVTKSSQILEEGGNKIFSRAGGAATTADGQMNNNNNSNDEDDSSSSSNIDGHGGQLSREFVARRFSEGETGRLKEELKCQSCGKGYKHVSSLAKHLWEHTPEWNITSKLLMSKHQQVQLLEAASVLVSMNEEEEGAGDIDQEGGTGRNNSAESESIPTAPNIPVDSQRSITKPHSHGRRASVTATGSLSSSFGRRRLSSGAGGGISSFKLRGTSPVTDSLFTPDTLHGVGDDYELLASPYQRNRRLSNLRHQEDPYEEENSIEDEADEEEDGTEGSSPNDDNQNHSGVFGDME